MTHSSIEVLMKQIAFLVGAALILAASVPAGATDYEYDALGRLVRAAYDNGDEITYEYDAAGNLVRVVTAGRDHRMICDRLEGRKNRPDTDVYRFVGAAGEAVTVRLEAAPRDGAAGRRATLTLQLDEKRSKKDPPPFSRSEEGVLPTEFTATLPKAGEYLVFVQEGTYGGDYCVTLEASPAACASFEPASGKGGGKNK